MTYSQLQYLNYIESARHNRVTEQATQSQLEEQQRHNLQSESAAFQSNDIQQLAVNETGRHNLISESISTADLSLRRDQFSETQRHNLVAEQQAQAELAEQSRHNKSQEAAAFMNANASLSHAQSAAQQAAVSAMLAENTIDVSWYQRNLYDAQIGVQASQERLNDANRKFTEVKTDAEYANVRSAYSQAEIARVDAQNRQRQIDTDLLFTQTQNDIAWINAITGGARNVITPAANVFNLLK